MQLHPHTADDADAFAEIDLRMARRVRERHEDLARPGARQPHVILHDRIAAQEAVLDPQPFENPLRRMPLLWRRHLVRHQDRVNHRNERPELRLFRLFAPHIARRRRIAAHLGDCVPAQSENPRRLATALPLDENKPSNRRINLHRKHPRPPLRIKVRKGSAQKWPGFTPPRATASCRRSVAYYCSAAYTYLTITALWKKLTVLDIKVGRSAVGRFLLHLKLTYKKNSARRGTGKARCSGGPPRLARDAERP